MMPHVAKRILQTSRHSANLIFLKGCLPASATLGAVTVSHVISRQGGRNVSRALSRNSAPPIGETGCISRRCRQGGREKGRKGAHFHLADSPDRSCCFCIHLLRSFAFPGGAGRTKYISARRKFLFPAFLAFSPRDSILSRSLCPPTAVEFLRRDPRDSRQIAPGRGATCTEIPSVTGVT